jgi:curved DNA-binding protein
MEFKNYYNILGVTKDSSEEDIKKTYRKLAKKWHPDKNEGNAESENKFKEISEAYSVLSDPEKRKKFDEFMIFGNNTSSQKGNSQKSGYEYNYQEENPENFSDFFKNIFNQKTRYSYFKGEDLRGKITIELEEAYKGSVRILNIRQEKIRITLEPGIKNEHIIRIAEKGQISKYGGKKGDLYIRVVVKESPIYKVVENDLYAETQINVFTALTGGKITLPHFGSEISITIPQLCPPGKKIRIKGKGMPVYKSKNEFGDLYLSLNYKLPDKLTDKEIALLNELKKA